MPVRKLPDTVTVTVVDRGRTDLVCLDCGSRYYEISRHRRKCHNCGSKRYGRRKVPTVVRRLKVRQSAQNRWPLKTHTVDAANPFGELGQKFKLEVVT